MEFKEFSLLAYFNNKPIHFNENRQDIKIILAQMESEDKFWVLDAHLKAENEDKIIIWLNSLGKLYFKKINLISPLY